MGKGYNTYEMMGALQASLGNCPSLRRAIESVLYMAECTKADEASEKVFYIILLCHLFYDCFSLTVN